MRDCTLLYFGNPVEFIHYINQFEIYRDWKIESGLMNQRGSKIEGTEFAIEVRKLFKEKNMFRMKASVAEMTTWLDSFVHLERLCNLMVVNFEKDQLNQIEIGFEYIVKLSKKSRVDVIIKYRSKYCLFEFSTVSSFGKLKPQYNKKRLELIIYKDMMHNYIEFPSKIICYPFIGLYEHDNGIRKEKFYHNNINNISYAYEYLKQFLLDFTK